MLNQYTKEKTAGKYVAMLARFYSTLKAAQEAMNKEPKPEVCRIVRSQEPKGYYLVKL